MDLIITLLVGALIGWIASMIMGTGASQGVITNIIVGIVGSFLGKFIFYDLLHIGGAATAGSFNVVGLIWGVLGAVILIAILKALHLFGK